jgi:anthranilate phosphoribosyltransferase
MDGPEDFGRASRRWGGLNDDSADMPATLHIALTKAAVGHELEPAVVAGAFEACCTLTPPARDVALGSLLMAVMANGPRVDHIEALVAQALSAEVRHPAERVEAEGPVLVLAGSGKKGMRTPNITTPAGLIAAAAGAKVVKVGSAGTSSVLGSRDLASALGIPEQRTATDVRDALARSGFAFVAV